jgi:hypothetical protein
VFGNDIKVLDLAVVYETGTSAAGHIASYATSDGCPHRNAHSSQDHRRV